MRKGENLPSRLGILSDWSKGIMPLPLCPDCTWSSSHFFNCNKPLPGQSKRNITLSRKPRFIRYPANTVFVFLLQRIYYSATEAYSMWCFISLKNVIDKSKWYFKQAVYKTLFVLTVRSLSLKHTPALKTTHRAWRSLQLWISMSLEEARKTRIGVSISTQESECFHGKHRLNIMWGD